MVSLLSLDPPMFPSLADRDALIQLSILESERADQQAQVLDSILEDALDNDTNSGSGILFEDKICIKRWHCPWDSIVVDYIAPVFRLILEENYLSSSMQPLEDTKKNRQPDHNKVYFAGLGCLKNVRAALCRGRHGVSSQLSQTYGF
ncbi:hypothetical protein HYC85_011969 [Camellia sinensis]|uniref:Uncharacterized protein n=1 Tax=Camellia sinensis TaxID=4442 RepID=A0A7J7HDV2_CAMSI|nr:hypothetical protein HYC85_011969 [Camellia sinensis]